MKICIIISKKIQEYAGFKYKQLMRRELIPFTEIDGYPHELEDKDIKNIDADFFIALGIHSLKDEKKRFCVHPNGNWGDLWPHPKRNSLGGKENTLCMASGALLKNVYLSLIKNNNLPDYKVSIECTHHGPNISKPIVFLEIGTSPDEWENIQSNNVIIQTLQDVMKGFEIENKSTIVFGGDHYMTKISRLIKERNIQVSHMCPSNQIHNLDENILKQAIEKTNEGIDSIFIDLAGVGQHKDRIIKLIEEVGQQYSFI